MEDKDITLKVLQIFYINGSELVVVDDIDVINDIYMRYTLIPPDSHQKITITSAISLKKFCFDTRYIATMVMCDPEDLTDNVEEENPTNEPWSA